MAGVTEHPWPELQRFVVAGWNYHYCLGRDANELEAARKEFAAADLALTIALGAKRQLDSPSSLNTYKTCPRQYLLEYCDDARRDENFASIENVMGSSVHETIEDFYRKGCFELMPDVEKAVAIFNEKLSYMLGVKQVVRPKPERNVEWAQEVGEDCIRNWWGYHMLALKGGAKDFQTEVKVDFPDDPKVRGYADLLYEEDGNLVCVDWKTGRLPFRGFKGSSVQKQIRIYGSALRLSGEERPILARAFYLAHNKAYTEKLTDDVVAATVAYCIKTRNEIGNEEEWDANTGPLCRWCRHSRKLSDNQYAQCVEGETYVNAD